VRSSLASTLVGVAVGAIAALCGARAALAIDPSVDTPAHLRAYADENGLDAARWRLLNGGPDQVRVLANALGIRYRAKGTGQYSHTVRVTLLDREGVVVDRVDGVEGSLAPLAERIAGLLAAPPP